MLAIDDYSRLTWVAFLKEKSEALENFKTFKVLTKNQTGKRLKVVRSDRGGELCSRYFKEFFDKMELRENTLFQGPRNRMELLRDRIGQYNKWQDQ